jgi:hypothetical protein
VTPRATRRRDARQLLARAGEARRLMVYSRGFETAAFWAEKDGREWVIRSNLLGGRPQRALRPRWASTDGKGVVR